jgi:hypothetical protein
MTHADPPKTARAADKNTLGTQPRLPEPSTLIISLYPPSETARKVSGRAAGRGRISPPDLRAPEQYLHVMI